MNLRGAIVHRSCRGNALLEFVLTLPIILFISGLTIHMSLAMLTKQQALVESRHQLWHAAQHGEWSAMKLEDWVPAADDEATYGHRPRGVGDELDRLLADVEPDTIRRISDPEAEAFWDRLWTNLPGRHNTEVSRTFETQSTLWDFIHRTAVADHWRDSSPWHFYHFDLWKIARSGPLSEIFESFEENLGGAVAEHFEPTRNDIIQRWWHGSDVLDEVAQGGD